MKAARVEAERWLRQAESDLAFADLGARHSFPAQACFTSHQAAEKALKSLRYLAGARFVPGHSLVELLGAAVADAPRLAGLDESARLLDQYYIPTRYPNGLPGGVPADVFTAAQAQDAVRRAETFVAEARSAIRKN